LEKNKGCSAKKEVWERSFYLTTPLKKKTTRPSVQVTMKAASQHFSPRASFKPICPILSKRVSHL